MFREPTVLVVGAGASADLGFPLGDGLRYHISETLKKVRTDSFHLIGPEKIVQAMRADAAETGRDINEYLRATRLIASHLLYARSIDDFIDHYQDRPVVVAVGKIAICYSILHFEKQSNLVVSNSREQQADINHKLLDSNDAWLKQLWFMMRQDVRRENPASLFENVSFINFNYDRTLEIFLTKALVDMYDMSPSEASRLVDNAPIHHPYGMVDRLSGIPGPGTPFGGGEHTNLLRSAGNIRTYCESQASPSKQAFASHLANASAVVFLGLAYRQLNLELLQSQGHGSLQLYGTAYGIPEENHSIIDGRLNGVFPRLGGPVFVRLRSVKSAELLRLYEEALVG